MPVAFLAVGFPNPLSAAVERLSYVGLGLPGVVIALADLFHRYPHDLSGGQQQRVALVRALASKPKLLLLDEPLSNLDARVRLRLREEIREILNAKGTSAIFVTHDQQEAFARRRLDSRSPSPGYRHH